MDIHMPGMGGIEATRQICAANPDVIVVLMSTYDVEDLPAAASDCGAAAYLHKERLSPELLSRIWRDSELKAPPAGGMVPHWRVPQVLLTTAVRSSSLLGHDLINRFRAERYQLFLSGHLALWAERWRRAAATGVRVLVPNARMCCCSPRSAPRNVLRWRSGCDWLGCGRYSQSISLVCITNWISAVLVTLVNPNFLPVMALVALVPVVFAEPYIRWQRGLAFTVITAVCVLTMAMLARFLPIPEVVQHGPRWLETLVIVVGVPFNAFHLMVIVWNNAAALRTSEARLADRAAELAASRTR